MRHDNGEELLLMSRLRPQGHITKSIFKRQSICWRACQKRPAIRKELARWVGIAKVTFGGEGMTAYMSSLNSVGSLSSDLKKVQELLIQIYHHSLHARCSVEAIYHRCQLSAASCYRLQINDIQVGSSPFVSCRHGFKCELPPYNSFRI